MDASGGFATGTAQPAVRRAIAFIDSHLGEDLQLDDIAAAARVSKFHFARQFRAVTGTSPMAYVMRSRIERAKRMLDAERGLIIEVALELGFCDQSHFTRSFRRETGRTPGQYQRQQR